MFSRSRSAYEALQSFNLLHLPSIDTLSDYKAMLKCDAGNVDAYLKKERSLYDEMIKEAKERLKVIPTTLIPLSNGALIFDEIKVTMQLQWNSSNDRLIGYAMTRDDMSSLRDVYELLGDNFKLVNTNFCLSANDTCAM